MKKAILYIWSFEKVQLQKVIRSNYQLSSFLFLVVLDQFYISRYHFYNFLELLFTMVFNIWKNIFVMNFPFLMDSGLTAKIY